MFQLLKKLFTNQNTVVEHTGAPLSPPEEDRIKSEIKKTIKENKMINVFFDLEPSYSVQRMGVVKRNRFFILVYNPHFVAEAIRNNAICDVILHEYLHVVLGHYERVKRLVSRTIETRNVRPEGDVQSVIYEIANVCADIVVNQYIINMSQKKQESEFYRKNFITLDYFGDKYELSPYDTLENYFSILYNSNYLGDFEIRNTGYKINKTEEKIEIIENQFFKPIHFPRAVSSHEIVQDTCVQEQKIGTSSEESNDTFYFQTMSQDVREKITSPPNLLADILRARRPGKSLKIKVREAMESLSCSEERLRSRKQTYRRPNKKHDDLPSSKNKKKSKDVVLFVDCSASMIGIVEHLWKYMVEINARYNVLLVPFNEGAIECLVQYYPRTKMAQNCPSLYGDGATLFNKAVEWVWKNHGKDHVFIILSDLEFGIPVPEECKKNNYIYIHVFDTIFQSEGSSTLEIEKIGIPLKNVFSVYKNHLGQEEVVKRSLGF